MVTSSRKGRRSSPAGGKGAAPRDREATRERILAAVGRLLAREGFSSLGVNAVAREAGVDKVLIYRYFGGIDALLDAWGREMLRGASAAASAPADTTGSAADRAVAALLPFGRGARENPEALEIMRWELVEANPLTQRLAELREAAGVAALEQVGLGEQRARELDVPALSALISAGYLHLALRAKTASHWLGVPLRTREGWARIERAAIRLLRSALADSSQHPSHEKGETR